MLSGTAQRRLRRPTRGVEKNSRSGDCGDETEPRKRHVLWRRRGTDVDRGRTWQARERKTRGPGTGGDRRRASQWKTWHRGFRLPVLHDHDGRRFASEEGQRQRQGHSGTGSRGHDVPNRDSIHLKTIVYLEVLDVRLG